MIEPGVSMQDQRRVERHIFEDVIPVHDAVTNEQIGQLANLSEHGLMLITRQKFETQALFRIHFDLPDFEQTFKLGVESLWVSDALSRNMFWVGFEIIDIDQEQRAQLAMLDELHIQA